jgi:L,D-peptidoglycan transpeptidase YkuD (ErfK/YbiS/YcfS/YnhG family)
MASFIAALATIAAIATPWVPGAAAARAQRLTIPRSANQLVVVSSPTAEPPGPQRLATLRAYVRPRHGRPWRLVFGPWAAETGRGHLVRAGARHEGDGSTPIGVFRFGQTIYGNRIDPGGLHYRYHRLVCGDWWDEDPYSPRYNHFVHVPCGTTPSFAAGSEALWAAALAYPYFAVVDFNTHPIRGGKGALGSGIFLHSWVSGPTNGCIALPLSRLLRVLRWLRPSQHPVVEIGTDAALAPLRPAS